jgi:hypothetical protein
MKQEIIVNAGRSFGRPFSSQGSGCVWFLCLWEKPFHLPRRTRRARRKAQKTKFSLISYKSRNPELSFTFVSFVIFVVIIKNAHVKEKAPVFTGALLNQDSNYSSGTAGND